MGGEGHIMDMISRMKANAAMRHKNNFYDRTKNNIKYRLKTIRTDKKASKELINKIHSEIVAENRRYTLFSVILIITLVSIFSYLLVFLINI